MLVDTTGQPLNGASTELHERLRALEWAQGNDDGDRWLTLWGSQDAYELSRTTIRDIQALARVMFLKNPLINRGVNVKASYIFSRPVQIHAEDDAVNTVLQQFLDDPRNQIEFTSHAVRLQRERELQLDGNIFFALVIEPQTGHIRIKTIPCDEITDIIADPNDRHAIWYYKREWVARALNPTTGRVTETPHVVYYRDFRYVDMRDQSIGDVPIISMVAIYHVKVGGFHEWKFGVSEIYSAQAWAKAYTRFLENWATIVAAHARFAFAVTTTDGQRGVDAAKHQLTATLGTSMAGSTSGSAGATYVGSTGNKIDPIRTANATTSADDGRRLLLMVCAAFGIPETFMGDVSVGTLATAESLDRPTELMLTNRQQLWRDIYLDILLYVVEWAVRAPAGALRHLGYVATNMYQEQTVVYHDGTPAIAIEFPSILQHSTQQAISAIVSAATLDGKQPILIKDLRYLAKLCLTELGESDVDTVLAMLFPDMESAVYTPPAVTQSPSPNTTNAETQTNATALEAAAVELRNALRVFAATIVPT